MNISPETVEEVLDLQSLTTQFPSREGIAELVQVFRDYLPSQMSQIRRALDSGTSCALYDTSHQFEMVLDTFHAPGATSAARQLELAAKQEELSEARNQFELLESEIEKLEWALAELTSD